MRSVLPLTSTENPLCPLCKQGQGKLWFQGRDTDHLLQKTFSLYRCLGCGFGFVFPLPDRAEIQKLYPDIFYRRSNATKTPRGLLSSLLTLYENLTYQERLSWIGLPARSDARLLDIGCGNGKFLHVASKQGWLVEGVEMSSSGARAARENDHFMVHQGNLTDLNLPASHFQAVTLWHVFEHIVNREEIIETIDHLLDPQGKVIIAVPNFDGFEAKLFKDDWALFDLPRHVAFFTPETLKNLVRSKGFKIIRESHFSWEFNIPIALQNVLNLLCREKMFLYNLAKREYQKSDFLSPDFFAYNLMASVLGALIFGPPAILSSFLFSSLKRGTTYTLCAGK